MGELARAVKTTANTISGCDCYRQAVDFWFERLAQFFDVPITIIFPFRR
jgi:hypothetical protein